MDIDGAEQETVSTGPAPVDSGCSIAYPVQDHRAMDIRPAPAMLAFVDLKHTQL